MSLQNQQNNSGKSIWQFIQEQHEQARQQMMKQREQEELKAYIAKEIEKQFKILEKEIKKWKK